MADDTITETEFLTWVPARDAFRIISNAIGNSAAGEMITRAIHNLLVARVENGFVKEYGVTKSVPQFISIGDTTWKVVGQERYLTNLGLWQSNSLEVELGSQPIRHYRLFGIRFDPAGLDKMVPKRVLAPSPAPQPVVEPAKPAPANPPPHAGGAPRKEFWDDLWLAMFEQLWVKNWQPKNQAEIEKAMLDWAAANGKNLGPTSVKTPARKLYALSKN